MIHTISNLNSRVQSNVCQAQGPGGGAVRSWSSCANKPSASLLNITAASEEKEVDDDWDLDDIYHVQCSCVVHIIDIIK